MSHAGRIIGIRGLQIERVKHSWDIEVWASIFGLSSARGMVSEDS